MVVKVVSVGGCIVNVVCWEGAEKRIKVIRGESMWECRGADTSG